MSKPSRRYAALVTDVDKRQVYSLAEAIAKAKAHATTKFDETLDVAINLGIDPRQSDQTVRGTVVLPHGTGRTVNVAVIADGADADAARAAGANTVGGDDLVAQIDGGWADYDILCATPAMMRVVGRLGRKLGPRMPNAKAGTVGPDIGQIVRELKAGKIQYRADNRGGVVRCGFGKQSFSDEALLENFNTLMGAILRAKPAAAKGQYLKKVVVSSTMGPSFKVDLADCQAQASSS
ncbi:MAG: 50S ribosomal protein L1 [Fimbriimonadaceae bacterium]|nr:50S ribosomal protein L1 [Fimbriimonadaceae bacterium]